MPLFPPIRSAVETLRVLSIQKKTAPHLRDAVFFSKGRTRTCDLRVMSPTSCQLLYLALLSIKYPFYTILSTTLLRCGEIGICLPVFDIVSQTSRPSPPPVADFHVHFPSYSLGGGSVSNPYLPSLRCGEIGI